MTPDASFLPDASATRAQGGFAVPETAPPMIHGWSVVGHDRLVGTLRDAESDNNGKKVITSPVLKVQLPAEGGAPIAHTQSGSLYRLARPAPGFGEERAEQFIRFKSRDPAAAQGAVEPGMQTALLKLPS